MKENKSKKLGMSEKNFLLNHKNPQFFLQILGFKLLYQLETTANVTSISCMQLLKKGGGVH